MSRGGFGACGLSHITTCSRRHRMHTHSSLSSMSLTQGKARTEGGKTLAVSELHQRNILEIPAQHSHKFWKRCIRCWVEGARFMNGLGLLYLIHDLAVRYQRSHFEKFVSSSPRLTDALVFAFSISTFPSNDSYPLGPRSKPSSPWRAI